MKFICYSRCSTCKKAESWLKEHAITFEKREIVEENPTEEELMAWHKSSGLPLKRFFNTSGNVYRENNLKEKLETMSEEEQYQILATDGMLVRRPLLIGESMVLVGFREEEWKTALRK